ncbi:MAG: MBL fold metallo-hydrolase [Magnetococcales bacterium]|nr:MBL fold metallo-hydrolase [Magnetococcales bacterium]
MNPTHFQDLSYDLTLIDTGYHRPGCTGSYLMESMGRAAFIETGHANAVPRLMDALEYRGLSPNTVDYVIVTHVHLDHAGGAGALLEKLPNALLVVHPAGAQHMVDPSRLIAGTRVVYGDDQFQKNFGSVVAVDPSRVIAVPDGYLLTLGDRQLTILDTPGHARHHICIWDAYSRGLFTGDAFGLSYRAFDGLEGPYIFPATTPIQFDPMTAIQTVDRLSALNPTQLFLTHFGMINWNTVVRDAMITQLKMIQSWRERTEWRGQTGPQRRRWIEAQVKQWIVEGLRTHMHGALTAQDRTLLNMDMELNAQGIDCWLAALEKQTAGYSA